MSLISRSADWIVPARLDLHEVEAAAVAYAVHDHGRQVRAGFRGNQAMATGAEALDAFYRWASRQPSSERLYAEPTRLWFTETYRVARAQPASSGRPRLRSL